MFIARKLSCVATLSLESLGPPRVLGILGEWLFIFRDLESTGYYFRGAGEQAHSFWDLGSPAKKQKNKGKASILFDFLKVLLLLGAQTPLVNPKCTYFRITSTSRLTSRKNMAIIFCCCSFITLKIVDF